VLSFEAGYAYASAVDPTTGADSNVLPVLSQMLAGLLFFTFGMHRMVIKAFADSLDRYPPAHFTLNPSLSQQVIRLGSDLFAVGLRLALPVLGLLLMTEVALGIMGRINSQLHLGQHSTPVKMMLAMLTFATILGISPALYQAYAGEVFRVVRSTFGD
jgi:flagellar biosynthetic protein FliR